MCVDILFSLFLKLHKFTKEMIAKSKLKENNLSK